MTLRDLLGIVPYKEVFNCIFRELFKTSGLGREKIMDYDIEYHALFMSLRNLPKQNPNNTKIYITHVGNAIDVCLFDEGKDEIFSLDSMDYKYIIDMEVYKAIDISDKLVVAHIFNSIKP